MSQNASEISYLRLNTACFVVVGAICMLNLNGLTAMIFGQSQLMSFFLLIAGALILLLSRNSVSDSLGSTGQMFCFSILWYLLVASVSEVDMKLSVSFLNSLFLIAVTSVATRTIVTCNGYSFFLFTMACVSVCGAASVFLSPYLEPYYSTYANSEVSYRAGRWMGFFANPNEAGIACVFALIFLLAFGRTINFSLGGKVVVATVSAMLALATLLTFSRGALFAFTLCGFASLSNRFRLDTKLFNHLLLCFVLIGIGFWFFTGGYELIDWQYHQRSRIESIGRVLGGDELSEDDMGGRFSAVKGAIDYWSESPMLGQGLGTFHAMPYQYYGGLGCHNAHVMILGESGILGAFFYCLWIVYFILQVVQLDTRYRGLAVSVAIAYLSYGMLSHNALEARNMNLVLGVVFGLLGAHQSGMLPKT